MTQNSTVVLFRLSHQPASLLGRAGEDTCPYLNRGGLLAGGVFLIPLPGVADDHACTQRHEGDWGQQQNQHGAADGVLALFTRTGGRAVAHDTALTEGRSSPEQQKYREREQAQLHCTPRWRIRNASGKNTSIMAKQNTSELMVTHFIAETSNFICMK